MNKPLNPLAVLMVFCTLACVVLSGYVQAAEINFMKGSLKKVQEAAAKEGKYYFVNFVASWCAPCKMMEETTFRDERLTWYISQNYLAAKIDIDDFDGMAYKNQYNIKVLPTILVFNTQGKLLGQYEESLSATALLEILKKHKPAPTYKPGELVRPPLPPTDNTAAPSAPATAPKPATPSAPATPASTVTSKGGLFRFEVKKQPMEGYSVQVGVYADYENVLREAAKFQEMFGEPVIVHIALLNGKTVYRVMLGNFSILAKAEKFRADVKQKGIDALVKNLADFK
jgi:thiol-disulfide isomerase/thioredoxin